MPSFTFFSPSLAPERAIHAASFSGSTASTNSTHTGVDLGNPLMSPNFFPSSRNDAQDLKEKLPDSKRSTGTGLRTLGIHNKRNQTIGLGEFNQLDFVITESVIRWASCTHLSTASSFRTSLIC